MKKTLFALAAITAAGIAAAPASAGEYGYGYKKHYGYGQSYGYHKVDYDYAPSCFKKRIKVWDRYHHRYFTKKILVCK